MVRPVRGPTHSRRNLTAHRLEAPNAGCYNRFIPQGIAPEDLAFRGLSSRTANGPSGDLMRVLSNVVLLSSLLVAAVAVAGGTDTKTPTKTPMPTGKTG